MKDNLNCKKDDSNIKQENFSKCSEFTKKKLIIDTVITTSNIKPSLNTFNVTNVFSKENYIKSIFTKASDVKDNIFLNNYFVGESDKPRTLISESKKKADDLIKKIRCIEEDDKKKSSLKLKLKEGFLKKIINISTRQIDKNIPFKSEKNLFLVSNTNDIINPIKIKNNKFSTDIQFRSKSNFNPESLRTNIQTDEKRGVSINVDLLPKMIHDGMIKNLKCEEKKRNMQKEYQNNLMVHNLSISKLSPISQNLEITNDSLSDSFIKII